MQNVFEQITLATLFGYCRDLSIAGAIITAGWKARNGWQHVVNFRDRVLQHMDHMEIATEALLENHLQHITIALDKIAKTDGSQISYDLEHR